MAEIGEQLVSRMSKIMPVGQAKEMRVHQLYRTAQVTTVGISSPSDLLKFTHTNSYFCFTIAYTKLKQLNY